MLMPKELELLAGLVHESRRACKKCFPNYMSEEHMQDKEEIYDTEVRPLVDALQAKLEEHGMGYGMYIQYRRNERGCGFGLYQSGVVEDNATPPLIMIAMALTALDDQFDLPAKVAEYQKIDDKLKALLTTEDEV